MGVVNTTFPQPAQNATSKDSPTPMSPAILPSGKTFLDQQKAFVHSFQYLQTVQKGETLDSKSSSHSANYNVGDSLSCIIMVCSLVESMGHKALLKMGA